MATETGVTPGLTLGPQDPDAASELTKRVGVHNRATQLLKRHAANFPAELTIALARPIDEERTEALDMEEVEKALKSLRGRRAFFKESTDSLEDAVVRGRTDKERVIAVVFRRGGERGRSAQGVIPYAGMSASIRAYEQAQARKSAGDASMALSVPDDAVEAANARAAQAEAAAKEAEEKRRQTDELHAELLERLERLENPEPFEGYDSLTAKDKLEVIREGGVQEYGRAGLERIRTYEESRKQPSKQVMDLVDDLLAETPQE